MADDSRFPVRSPRDRAAETEEHIMSSSTFDPPSTHCSVPTDVAAEVRQPREEQRFSAVPDVLKTIPSWVIWRREPRDGAPTKVPYQSASNRHAKANERSTWSTFHEAVAGMSRYGADGIG